MFLKVVMAYLRRWTTVEADKGASRIYTSAHTYCYIPLRPSPTYLTWTTWITQPR